MAPADNIREAVERLLERHLPVITEAFKPVEPDPNQEPASSPNNSPAEGPMPREMSASPASVTTQTEAVSAKHQQRIERFERVRELHRQGTPIRQIARDLDLSRRSVRSYLHREKCPDWRPGRTTRSRLDEHRDWIDAHIATGRINALKLHGELAARGVCLSYAAVRRYLNKRLGQTGRMRARANAAKPKPAPPPSPRRLSFDWVRRPEKRDVECQARLEKIRAASPDLAMALDFADEFVVLIRKQSSGTLADWLSRAEVSACPELRHFAESIRRDESAVTAAVTTPWSNGPVEGHVNRLKTIKRQMYGRAGLELLKARIVAATRVRDDAKM